MIEHDPGSALARWLAYQMKQRRVRSERELARKVKVSPDTVSRILRGERTGLGTLERLADWAGESSDKLVGLVPAQRREDRPGGKWPVYGGVRAGKPLGLPIDWLVFEPPYATDDRDRWLCIQITGDCLAPAIQERDRVWVDTMAEARGGNIVIVEHEGETLCKRIAKTNGRTVLTADDGTVIRPNGETRVIGVVVEIIRRVI